MNLNSIVMVEIEEESLIGMERWQAQLDGYDQN